MLRDVRELKIVSGYYLFSFPCEFVNSLNSLANYLNARENERKITIKLDQMVKDRNYCSLALSVVER